MSSVVSTGTVQLVSYEDITQAPEEMLKKIYNFIEEPYFDHNLNDISQNENYEHDNVYYAEKISHSTKSVFKYYKEPDRKLPQWFHNQVVSNNPFFYNSFYPDVKVDK